MRNSAKRLLIGLVGGLLLVFPAAALGADHLDAPLVKSDGRIDINDVYVFQGADPSSTVLSFDVNPAAGVLSPTTFRSDAIYTIRVDTNGDLTADIAYRFTFTAPAAGDAQVLTVTRAEGADAAGYTGGAVVATGATNTNLPVTTGGWAFAGLVDDPFFFDLVSFNEFKAELLEGNLSGAASICSPNPSPNFFSGFNASALVIEVPDSALGSDINVWAETALPISGTMTQVERMGKPAINTVFNHTDDEKQAYNFASPAGDVSTYRDRVSGVVELIRTLLGENAAEAEAYGDAIAGALLPDVLSYNTASAADYTMLNGRALADDVIDFSYAAVTGGTSQDPPGLTSDCVASDSAFRAGFPYWGAPNPIATPSPSASTIPNTADDSGTSQPAIVVALIAVAGSLIAVSALQLARQRRRIG